MKKVKTHFFIALCFIMAVTFYKVNSKASGPLDGQMIDGSLLTSESQVEDTKPLLPDSTDEREDGIMPFGTYLSNGTAALVNKGGGTVYIAGETYCYRVSDVVKVNLYLEQLSNGSWHTVQSRPYTAYNTYVASSGIYFAVSKGYYYRVRGYHSAQKGSTYESTSTCTNGIYID